MTLRIAGRWFETRRIDDDLTLITEPHVDPYIRCNIWHVRGGERDLLIDTGLGIASLKALVDAEFARPVTALATHTHYDHSGGMHEFAERIVHRAEAGALAAGAGFAALLLEKLDPDILAAIRATGYDFAGDLLAALPHEGYDPALYAVRAAPATRIVEEGDIVAAGRRRFEVLHLPGHSPGQIGLWEAATGVLFSGDAIYDGALVAGFPGGDVPAYRATLERLMRLPVRVVHAGHEASFGAERLREIARLQLIAWS